MMWRPVAVLVWLLVAALPGAAVDYVRLSPSEFSEDLTKASELAKAGDYEAAIALLRVLVRRRAR